ncbi:MAG: protein translocase subunit SecF [Deltaproteobacteria bacterium HGW-Deltaproteobacteria-15]|jgi:preprotein translocase subunit SecF|nr:MAG: protein translocase subunit SecF [Deltaproteobacteria bacterium HGW-Deltaproteobacteria-15]
MEIFRPGINLNFVGRRYIALGISAAAILITILLLAWRGGPNYGVDFAGGIVIQVKLEKRHSPSELRQALEPIQLGDSIIQEFGEKEHSEYLIRVSKPDVKLTGLEEKVRNTLSSQLSEGVELRRVEMVGPQVGEDLRTKALYAIFYAVLMMAVYISGRFEHKWLMSIIMAACLIGASSLASIIGVGVTWLIVIALGVTMALCWFMNLRYALGAIVSIIHDVIIVIGAFALTDREISLTIVAAFLTIVGYSLNDTIVVFDRIRENLGKLRKRRLHEIMNISINETLSRTILTGTTTLIVLIIMIFLGGPVIRDFVFALLVGIVTGTYSSIYVASPILLLWETEPSKGTAGKKVSKAKE